MTPASMRLYGPVGGGFPGDGERITAKGVAEGLDRHRASGAKRLDVFLSSDGGNVAEGLAIYSQIQRFPGDVTVHVDGRAVSIASVIALAGNRLVMPSSALMMIHSPWIVTVGNAAEHIKRAADLNVMAETMRDIYANASGLPADKVQKMMDEETWLTAHHAMELGFADEVLEDQKPARAAGSTLLDLYRKTPAGLRTMRAEAALERLSSMTMRKRIEVQARGASAPGPGASARAADTTKAKEHGK